jgi:hypothetical protein
VSKEEKRYGVLGAATNKAPKREAAKVREGNKNAPPRAELLMLL